MEEREEGGGKEEKQEERERDESGVYKHTHTNEAMYLRQSVGS